MVHFPSDAELETAAAVELEWMKEFAADLIPATMKHNLHAVQSDSATDGIMKLASELGASAVVVGSTGKGQIKRALLGSVSSYLAHHCEQPVVIVRLPKAQGTDTAAWVN